MGITTGYGYTSMAVAYRYKDSRTGPELEWTELQEKDIPGEREERAIAIAIAIAIDLDLDLDIDRKEEY